MTQQNRFWLESLKSEVSSCITTPLFLYLGLSINLLNKETITNEDENSYQWVWADRT
jgi:hypothetical protein